MHRTVSVFIFYAASVILAHAASIPPDGPTVFPVVAGITFAQAATFDGDGNLYFVNYMRDGTIGRLQPDGETSIWLEIKGSQFSGLVFNNSGNLIATDYKGKRLVRILPNKTVEVLASGYQGKPFRGLNNVCRDKQGNVYFAEPDSSKDVPPTGRVYKYAQSGVVTLVDDGLAMPNGLAISPDGNRLLVVESRRNRILTYDLTDSQTPSKPSVFYRFVPPHPEAVSFDSRGRVWVSRWNDEIDLFSADGTPLRAIPAGGEMITNLTWWGDLLYASVAGRHSIHKLSIDSQVTP